MDQNEIKDTLKAAITSLVKDDNDGFNSGLHDVLAVKMRDRTNPPSTDPASEVSDPVDNSDTE